MSNRSPFRNLYVSHALSTIGDRIWQFAVPLLLVDIFPFTLLPTAIFVFFTGLAKAALLPFLGRIVDSTDRLLVAKMGSFVQNAAIAISMVLLFVLDIVTDSHSHHPWTASSIALYVVFLIVGITGDVISSVATINVEKNWVMIIVEDTCSVDPTENPMDLQTHLNSILRRIDLVAKMASPLVIGLLLTGGRSTVIRGLVAVGGWCLLTAWPIYATWKRVYDTYPGLRVKPTAGEAPPARSNILAVLWSSWASYSRHPVFLASLSYCFLHFTVLSDHHPLTTAFLAEENMSPFALGVARAAGSISGILATAIWPKIVKTCHDDSVRAGGLALWAFWGCITLIAIEFAFHTPIETAFMLTMIVISRMFLWQFDLANVAIIQRLVAQSERVKSSESSCHACTENVRALLDARRRLEDLTAQVANSGPEGLSPSHMVNEQLGVQLEEMKEIAGQLAELFRDLLAVLEAGYHNKADVGTLGLDLLKCLAPVKGFGQILTDHYDRFESSIAAAGYKTMERPAVYPTPRPLPDHGRAHQEFSDVVAAYRSERYPLESDSDSASTGFSAARRRLPPSSAASSSEHARPPPHIPSPSRVGADIGVARGMPYRTRAVEEHAESDDEDLGSFLDHLRRKSMRTPLPSSSVATDRDEEVSRFLDRVIPQGAPSRSSVPAIPYHGDGWRAGSTRLHRQTLA
ncbi:hypothetical protein FOL47_008780 [Perkinsus chesapeaki]|uniref:Solute carrier family 40 protein n=1 Tax=Perkinsus chesapeaki TaxID=330153 RepID=A0A7J6MU36_PERCH|nr:hypothetical protein FOL47_008780 [Perkinsus chesapeaki]